MKADPSTTSVKLTIPTSNTFTGHMIEVADGGGMRSTPEGIATLAYPFSSGYESKGSKTQYLDNGDGTATVLRQVKANNLVVDATTGAVYEMGALYPIDGINLREVLDRKREALIKRMRSQGFTDAEIDLIRSKG